MIKYRKQIALLTAISLIIIFGLILDIRGEMFIFAFMSFLFGLEIGNMSNEK